MIKNLFIALLYLGAWSLVYIALQQHLPVWVHKFLVCEIRNFETSKISLIFSIVGSVTGIFTTYVFI